MPNRKKQENPLDKMNIKRKARKSFSVPKKINAKRNSITKPMIIQLRSQGKVTNEVDAGSSDTDDTIPNDYSLTEAKMPLETSASDLEKGENSLATQISNESLDDDGWQTETSVEKLRSSEFLSIDEIVIPPPLSFSDRMDLASLDFLDRDNGPVAYSTPFSFSDGKSFRFSVIIESMEGAVPKASSTMRSIATQHGVPLALPNVTYAKEFADESVTLEDDDFRLKSLSPEQSMPLPDFPDDGDIQSHEKREDEGFKFKAHSPEQRIQYPDGPEVANNEIQEQHEDSALSFKIPASDGFDFSEDSDKHTKQDDDDEDDKYSRKNLFRSSIIKTYSRKRKQKDKMGNSSEDMNDYRNKEKLQDNEFDNNMPETSTHPRKTNNRFKFGTRKLTYSKNLKLGEMKQKRKLDDKKRNSFEGADCNRAVHFEEVQNHLCDTPKKEKPYSGKIKSSNPRKKLFRRNRTKKGGNLSEDKNNDNEDSFENIQNVYNGLDEVGNFAESIDHCNMGDNFEEAPNIEIATPKENLCEGNGVSYSKRIKTPFRRKHTNERTNSSEDINQSGSKDNLKNYWCTQNEELQDNGMENNRQETYTLQKKRKNNKHVEVDNITQQNRNTTNISQSSPPLRSQQKNGGENLFEDINQGDCEDSFENVQNIQDDKDKVGNSSEGNHYGEVSFEDAHNILINTAKEKRKPYRYIRTKSKQRMQKPMNEEENSFEDMNQSNGEDTFENVQNIQNDKDKVGNSSKDNYNGEDTFEEVYNVQINTSKQKRKPLRDVGRKSKGRVNRSRKAAKNLSRSKNSSSLKYTEDAINSKNEGKKSNWPRCCIEAMEPKTFRVLKPVFRDDVPMDTITMLCWGNESKENCKH